jgi:hypothetical protein
LPGDSLQQTQIGLSYLTLNECLLISASLLTAGAPDIVVAADYYYAAEIAQKYLISASFNVNTVNKFCLETPTKNMQSL